MKVLHPINESQNPVIGAQSVHIIGQKEGDEVILHLPYETIRERLSSYHKDSVVLYVVSKWDLMESVVSGYPIVTKAKIRGVETGEKICASFDPNRCLIIHRKEPGRYAQHPINLNELLVNNLGEKNKDADLIGQPFINSYPFYHPRTIRVFTLSVKVWRATKT
ncbi:hypothetical protein ACOME3_000393 [Neoechinorhynchus agilis]